jgi:hypothetical protein
MRCVLNVPYTKKGANKMDHDQRNQLLDKIEKKKEEIKSFRNKLRDAETELVALEQVFRSNSK